MKKFLVFLSLAFLLGMVSQASATPITLDYGDAYFLGAILPGTPASEAEEAGYVNTLTTVDAGLVLDVPGDRIYDRSDSPLTLVGPFPEADDYLADNVDVPEGGDSSLSADFAYVLGKYGTDTLVWYIANLPADIDEVILPTKWTLTVEVETPAGVETITYGGGLSHKTGFNPVPEPSTMLLLGVGLVGLVGVTKKVKK